VRQLGEAEVHQLRLAAGGHEHVAGLHVAVDDPLRVGRVERVGQLDREVEEHLRWQRPATQPLPQGLALQQLHDDEGAAAVLVDVVNGADAGVVEGGGGPRFALEALQGLGVPRERLGQQLERDLAPELQVAGAEDLAHASRPEGGEDLVVPEASSRLEGHGSEQSDG